MVGSSQDLWASVVRTVFYREQGRGYLNFPAHNAEESLTSYHPSYDDVVLVAPPYPPSSVTIAELVLTTIRNSFSSRPVPDHVSYPTQGHKMNTLDIRYPGQIHQCLYLERLPLVLKDWPGENLFDGCIACTVFGASEIQRDFLRVSWYYLPADALYYKHRIFQMPLGVGQYYRVAHFLQGCQGPPTVAVF